MTRLWIYRSGPPAGWQAAAGARATQRQHRLHLLSRSASICMLIRLCPHLGEKHPGGGGDEDEELAEQGAQRAGPEADGM